MGILSHVGTVAAVCTTGAFIPQIIKIKKQGGEDLSYAMLVFYLTGVLLWLAYGLMLHAPEIIWANAATAFLVLVALALKATYGEKSRA
jgi:MtN3 and saliva related transmembrane protein